jgi:glucosyl-dolichyl phosphate glucuronosyltransferase
MLEGQGTVNAQVISVTSVTIVICTYTKDRWVMLLEIVEAARRQVIFGDELLLVVDHNEELLVQCCEHFNDLMVIANRYSCGVSGARNTALDEASGSIIVFLDDDAIPLDDWLNELRIPYSESHVQGVGGLVQPKWTGIKPKWFPDEFLWVVGCSYRGMPTELKPIRNLAGANMSFRRTAFDTVGRFTEQLGRARKRLLSCEDTEFSIRLAKANPEAVMLYQPVSQVEHHVGEQRKSLTYFARRCWWEGLSKAEVAKRVGGPGVLRAELDYTARVLPRGFLAGLRDFVTGDMWGAARCAAIVLGLVITVAGYCVGIISRPFIARRRNISIHPGHMPEAQMRSERCQACESDDSLVR